MLGEEGVDSWTLEYGQGGASAVLNCSVQQMHVLQPLAKSQRPLLLACGVWFGGNLADLLQPFSHGLTSVPLFNFKICFHW